MLECVTDICIYNRYMYIYACIYIYTHVLQRAAACCSMLQYVAVCCRVLQSVAGSCLKGTAKTNFKKLAEMQCIAEICRVLQSVAVFISEGSSKTNFTQLEVCCSALQFVAVCCSVMQGVS